MDEREHTDFLNLKFQHSGPRYVDVLKQFHVTKKPALYLEIGTRFGDSLELATADSIAIDPNFQIKKNSLEQRKRTFFFRQSSDSFFAEFDIRALYPQGIDMAFIDGMHRFEYVLRDFINIERAGHNSTFIFLHDCFPLNVEMASRDIIPFENRTEKIRMWTGDVWKILPTLRTYRPELNVAYLDAKPTGLVAVTNCDPDSTILQDNYDRIVSDYVDMMFDEERLADHWANFPPANTRVLLKEMKKLDAQGPGLSSFAV